MNTRSKIALRWSTAPDDMGYGPGPAPKRLAGPPAIVTGPAGALAYRAEIMHNTGGCYIRWELLHKGIPVSWDDIRTLLEYASAPR